MSRQRQTIALFLVTEDGTPMDAALAVTTPPSKQWISVRLPCGAYSIWHRSQAEALFDRLAYEFRIMEQVFIAERHAETTRRTRRPKFEDLDLGDLDFGAPTSSTTQQESPK